MAPAIAVKKRIKSVYTTPLKPPTALKINVTPPAYKTVSIAEISSIIAPIFIAAKVTPAIAKTLNIIPK